MVRINASNVAMIVKLRRSQLSGRFAVDLVTAVKVAHATRNTAELERVFPEAVDPLAEYLADPELYDDIGKHLLFAFCVLSTFAHR